MRQTTEHHPPDDELLLAADRELRPARQAAIDGHLSHCAPCTHRLAQMQTVLRDACALYRAGDRTRPGHGDAARARLELALGDLTRTWGCSWPTRLRRALATTHAWAVLGVATPFLFAVAWLSQPAESPWFGYRRPAAVGAALPISSFTPGAVAPLTTSELCGGTRPSRRVSVATRDQVLDRYGMRHVSAERYELDALITPELGGTTGAENLWPQMYGSTVWNARVKDELERLLPQLVCRGELDLARAQQEIANDWIAAYKRHFRTDAPLRAHVGPPPDDDDELEFESPFVLAQSRGDWRFVLAPLTRSTD